MRTFPFAQIDAFTTTPLAGNACAVVFDADPIDEPTMLAIAREMNLSETAFVVESKVADFGARYFTPGGEIPMAGHPTIATVFALAESGRLPLPTEHTRISLELKVGPIPIDVRSEGGKATRITMSQKSPEFLRCYEAADVLPAFGLSPDDLLPGAPIQTVSTGAPQLMIPVRGLEPLRRMRLDSTSYRKLLKAGDFLSAHLFCLSGATERGRTFARHFGVPPDDREDPFTGSATGGMAAFLWHHNLIDEPAFVAEQGHWMNRPGEAAVEVVGSRTSIETVRVGGAAVTVLRGELEL
jgi:trans-2,3-dihydro-3-hydroxyanthranilate isomerase